MWEARKHYQNNSKSHSKHWSENAVHFIEQHRDIVDIGAFRLLTNIDSLPIISPDAAVGLMEQEQELQSDDSTEVNRVTLTCLQNRCTEALYDRIAGDWLVSKKDDLLNRLKRLPPVVLDTIISWTIQYKGIPTAIEVSGAGHNIANGVYVATTIYNNKLKFVKGNACTIYSKGRGFYLSVDDIKLYYAENKSSKSSLPPVTGWGDGIIGITPPTLSLTLRFTYDK